MKNITYIHKFLTLYFLTVNLTTFTFDSKRQFVSICLPKCGTFLIMNCLDLLTGMHESSQKKSAWQINLGDLKNLKANEYYATHAPFCEKNLAILQKLQAKGFLIIRDPRDQLVSLAYYLQKMPATKLRFGKYAIKELLLKLINNYYLFNVNKLHPHMKTISDAYTLYLNWTKYAGIYITTFEKLIGPDGGGDKNMQLQEIIKIGQHLGKEISPTKAEEIASKMFGNSKTFRSGKIGSWKSHFDDNHKDAFKRVAGQLLIELGYEKDLNW